MDDHLFLLASLWRKKTKMAHDDFQLIYCPLIYHLHARSRNRKDSWLCLPVLGLFHELFWFELQFTVRIECLDVKLSSLWAAALPHTLWQCKLGSCLCLTGSWNLRISILRKAKYSVRRTYCIAAPIASMWGGLIFLLFQRPWPQRPFL